MVRIHLGLPPLLWVSDAGERQPEEARPSDGAGGGGLGDVAQLAERLVCNQEVVGSNPIVSTSLCHHQLVCRLRSPLGSDVVSAGECRRLKFFDKLGVR